jgi:phosphate acetyltransferase
MERTHEKYQRLLDFCKSLPPTPTAVAHPCDESSLRGAVEAGQLGLISPILVGPRARIEALAKQHGIDLANIPIVDAPYSEASAAKAVELVREGKAEALMKGSLHTDELMGAVVRRETGLRTARRVSHCFVMDVPSYAETLIVTDAAINIAPTLQEERLCALGWTGLHVPEALGGAIKGTAGTGVLARSDVQNGDAVHRDRRRVDLRRELLLTWAFLP